MNALVVKSSINNDKLNNLDTSFLSKEKENENI